MCSNFESSNHLDIGTMTKAMLVVQFSVVLTDDEADEIFTVSHEVCSGRLEAVLSGAFLQFKVLEGLTRFSRWLSLTI